MNLSVCLLAASLATHQAQLPTPVEVSSDQPAVISTQSAPVWTGSSFQPDEGRRPWFPRLHGLLFGSKKDKEYMPESMEMMPIQSMPMQQVESAPPPRAIMASEPPRTVQQAHLELDHQGQQHVGAAPDYSSVTGQLFKIHAGGAIYWSVRYASPEKEDRFGGSIVLAPTSELRNFREGDLVCVHGGILDEERANKYLGGALFRAESIELIQHGDAHGH
jgi:hypothetical protein